MSIFPEIRKIIDRQPYEQVAFVRIFHHTDAAVLLRDSFDGVVIQQSIRYRISERGTRDRVVASIEYALNGNDETLIPVIDQFFPYRDLNAIGVDRPT